MKFYEFYVVVVMLYLKTLGLDSNEQLLSFSFALKVIICKIDDTKIKKSYLFTSLSYFLVTLL